MTHESTSRAPFDGPGGPDTGERYADLEGAGTPDDSMDSTSGDAALPATKPVLLVVGVGASAGGLEAFIQLLKNVAPDTGMAFVLVQHLDPEHESALVEILGRAATLPVEEITNGLVVEPNRVYVIPRNTALGIERGVLMLRPRDPLRRPPKPIDAFFESLAQDQRERAVGVVLSGTGSDGTLGLEAVKAEGGITFAQDDTAKYESMPRSAIASGAVDLVLSPAGIAEELSRIAKHPDWAGPLTEPASTPGDTQSTPLRGEDDLAEANAHADDDAALPSGGPPEAQGEPDPRGGAARAQRAGADASERRHFDAGRVPKEDDYRKILLLLRNHSGVDFTLYKSTTIRRRVLRRLLLTKSHSLGDYARSLRGNTKELDALYSDVLISVTSFFRNPETFDALRAKVLPTLLDQRTDEPVRCWVLGCSTGQEAYSLAMAFVEVAEKMPHTRQLQVFATDLNESLLDKARQGLYAKSLAEDISPQRLRRFFTEEQGGYRVSKSLREMVVFARQNLISDPPFSRMDLVSCRNLLIYLEPSLQRRAIPTFHYALRAGGFLLLGASESIGGFTELFEPVDKKHKIYAKKAATTPAFHIPLNRTRGSRAGLHASGGAQTPVPAARAGRTEPLDGLRGDLNAQREADRVAVSQFAPPGVLINAENRVLQFRGPTGAYLQPPPGKASFDVLKMAREGLMMPLRAAIEEARRENRSARREGVRVRRVEDEEGEERTRTIDLEVIPLRNVPEFTLLVVFIEPERTHRNPRPGRSRPALSKADEADRVAELEVALAEIREYLQATQEQHEATNEELQASNEEVQSANEELQSVNEELETSKEELESANEELTTVNDEMGHRNSELTRLNNDLVNLQTSAKLAILLVGRDLSITRFSPHAEKQFDLIATDLGRPIGHIRHQLVLASDGTPLDLESLAGEVIASVREQEWEVRDRSGRWYSLRVRPYMTLDNRIDGAVLVLVDIDELKGVEKVVAAARDYAQNTVATVREPMLVLDQHLRVESANLAFYRAFGVLPKQTIGNFVYNLGNGQWNIPGLRSLLETTLTERPSIEDFLVEHEFPGIGRRVMLLNARRMHDPQKQVLRILLAIEDITSRQRAEADTAHLAAIVASSDDAIISEDLGGIITSWNRGAERLFGHSAEEMVGQAAATLVPADRAGELTATRDVLSRGHSVQHLETLRHRKDGSLVDVSVTISPLRDAAGQVIGASTVARDITERKQTEERLRQAESRLKEVLDEASLSSDFRALFEASPTPFIVLTPPDYRIIAVNDAYLRATMTQRDEILGQGFFATFPDNPDEPQAGSVRNLRASLERVRSNRKPDVMAVLRYDMRRPPKMGGEFEPRYWSPINAPVLGPDGGVAAIIHRVEDVTAAVFEENHAPQDQLMRDQQGVIDRLREAVDQLTRNETLIRDQTEAIASESRRKDEFLAMLSHELRNPLAPIRSATHLLKLRERPGNEDPVQRQACEIIERQVGNMTKLINDLLEVSRVVSGRLRLNLQPSDVNQLVQLAIETVTPLIEQRGHTLTLHSGRTALWSQADAVRIEEVFVNLLNNAAKYTDEGGRIEVWCERLPGEGDKALAQVRVRDNGVGIPPRLLPRVFDLFTQSDRTLDRAQGGLGIGLTLAHRLVSLHGGSIEAKSPPDGLTEGSEFVVRLPLVPIPEISPVPPPESDHQDPSDGMRVLVVDDNSDQAMMLAIGLRHAGYIVECVYNGPDGLATAQQSRPDFVLLDIGLPGMDGYEVARLLRANEGLGDGSRSMKLIALTGYGRDSDRDLAREAGFDGHLVKPVEFKDLVTMMKTLSSSLEN